MGLSFIFGASGAGKSTVLYERVLQEAQENPDRNFYLIVPDQFTMQTQKEIVERSPVHGIMNIDVLSFGRLSYRVLEETGGVAMPVLDDTGKNLILRIVADRMRDQLGVLGARLQRPGYIHEVKSAISEFMQYRIGQAELREIIACASGRAALSGKLQDLSVLYGGFTDYIRDHYITTEESMEVLAKQIGKSQKLRGAFVAFDGFTGFTPVQLQVIEQLLLTAQDVVFAMTTDGREDPFAEDGEQKLFHLIHRTVRQLCRCAERVGMPHGGKQENSRDRDVFLREETVHRFAHQPVLAHLERNLFRYPQESFTAQPDGIELSELSSPREEARFCARKIRRLVREKGYCYRDIAVVCGSLDTYAPHIRSEFTKEGIPFFLDQTHGILLNPFVEFLKSALALKLQDYSVDSVNHYLRSGLTDFSPEEIDELDNYIRATGIRGGARYRKPFTRLPAAVSEEDALAQLKRLNGMRIALTEATEPLQHMGETASEKIRALYSFTAAAQVQEKLLAYEKRFEAAGEPVRAREYHQIYPYIIDLFSQVDTLLGQEKLSDREFSDLLEAGFSEMEVGAIPQNVDHITVGDMERSRLKDIRVLLFLGVNDGNIPKHADKGGIISDIDREFLQTTQWEFAPSPRQKMYIQRLYLYLNMTKPSEKLVLSFARTGSDGKSLRPAYLIEMIRKLYPGLQIMRPEEYSEAERFETWEDGLNYLAEGLRSAAAGELADTEQAGLYAALQLYDGNGQAARLLDAAFSRYLAIPLPQRLAGELYGSSIVSSITRLERYAACAYAHFLQYGLRLKERELFSFEPVDMGSLFHEILADFSERLVSHGYTWKDFPRQEGLALLSESAESCAAACAGGVLYDNARSLYALVRIKRILERTVLTLQTQLQQGDFEPEQFELPFRMKIREQKTDGQDSFELTGRIDRIDSFVDQDTCMVKVLDYKSGSNQFDATAFHHGLQLQLMTYLHAALQHEQEQHPGLQIVPAGVFYYHLDDPILDLDGEIAPEALQEQLLLLQRVTGLVNADETVIRKIDHTPGNVLTTLPLTRKTDGSFKESPMLMQAEDLQLLTDYAMHKMHCFTREIQNGNIAMTPYERKSADACTYCPYSRICGFDPKVPGYRRMVLAEEKKDVMLESIRQELQQETAQQASEGQMGKEEQHAD